VLSCKAARIAVVGQVFTVGYIDISGVHSVVGGTDQIALRMIRSQSISNLKGRFADLATARSASRNDDLKLFFVQMS
jgi:hypothetical protein